MLKLGNILLAESQGVELATMTLLNVCRSPSSGRLNSLRETLRQGDILLGDDSGGFLWMSVSVLVFKVSPDHLTGDKSWEWVGIQALSGPATMVEAMAIASVECMRRGCIGQCSCSDPCFDLRVLVRAEGSWLSKVRLF